MNYCHFTLNYSKLSIFTLSYLNYCFELCGQGHSSMLIAGINISILDREDGLFLMDLLLASSAQIKGTLNAASNRALFSSH